MNKRIVSLLLLIIMIGLAPLKASAQDGTMNFSVTAVIPENQIDKTKTYFDLKMKPGQVQELEVLMNNPLDKEVTVENYANTAITNDNGIVDYSNSDPTLDKTLKAPFSIISEVEKESTIPAKSSKTLKVKVTMPDEELDGVILGGLHFTEKEDKTKENKDNSGVQIKNRFAFAIGVLIRENDNVIKPDLLLGKIQPSQVNYRNVLKANIQNTQPVIIQKLEVDARVTKKGSKETLFEQKKPGIRMAPNSNFNFGTSWENEEFKAGKYTLHMNVSNGSEKWKWSKDFEISQKDAKKLNEQAVELKVDPTNWYIFGGVAAAVLLMIITFAFSQYISKKKQQKRKKLRANAAKRKKSKNRQKNNTKNKRDS
ncbi:cell surface protein [Enterococcus silesiacus]|uniref:Cell surface protein n=1 Tax=Enterococcus silesiacus TaxID=332949 RepID=A0A0S3K904_9ENTE|nr:DUF916 and DUF3324 domain-containing protein [Enterococcus silesiacus]ALS00767.1 cell surface protein [Enterococcus silesiacus]OJG92265.1 hypothetical protein RV15_GL003367 [Enterococcus silesiacus]